MKKIEINGEIREYLKKIVEFEEKRLKSYKEQGYDIDKPWWEWQEVAVPWEIVKKLLLSDLLDVIGGRRKMYALKDREKVKQLIEKKDREIEIRDDLFDVIEGYDDVKKWIKKGLKAERNIHFLLVGEPATAKSLFLLELERIGGIRITAGTTTKVGLRDLLLDKPKLLLIDEIDKIDDPRDLSALLTWMEEGKITVVKHLVRREEKIDKCMVVGACNSIDRLPKELLSRFMIFHFKEYSDEEFLKVVVNVLKKLENKDEEFAKYVAFKLLAMGKKDVRDAIKIARLCDSKEDVDDILKTWGKYSL